MKQDRVERVTELILEVFRLNGALIEAGNDLVGDLGITSARWQVLGALALADTRLTVPDIARVMGLTRQAVQRLVNEMAKDDIVELADNVRHKRSKLVVLTEKGKSLYASAEERQRPWAEWLGGGLTPSDLEAVVHGLTVLRRRLEAGDGDTTGQPLGVR